MGGIRGIKRQASLPRSWSPALIAAVCACLAPAAQAITPPLSHNGLWITDPQGRVVITHGVNLVYKRPPYQPGAAGFSDDDARFLSRHGFTSVRLGVIYSAVEPQPGHYDNAYIGRIARIQRLLARHGIYSLLDFHQDLFNERFGGEGFPDWAVQDSGLPAEPLTGFPGTYITSPGENAAWEALWANAAGPDGIGLQDHYAAAWAHVAARFAASSHLLGYDLINEPWPGLQFPTCATPLGCPLFEAGSLGPMERRVIDAIRAADRRHLVWYEPVVTSQFGTEYNIPDLGDPRAGMSFHTYCLTGALGLPAIGGLTCPALERLSISNAIDRAKANGDAILLSEWGSTADEATIKRMVDLADRQMLSWQWWHYCACEDPTSSGPGAAQAIVVDPSKPPRGDNVLSGKLALIERPYPERVNGTPKGWSFDRDSGVFELAVSRTSPSGKRLAPALPTQVYIPRSHYPRGYIVKAEGMRVVSRPGAPLLELRWTRGAGTAVMSVSPRAAG